jgi:multiple sugar transport system permease protein
MAERTRHSVGDWIVFVLLLLGAVITVGPFAWMLSTSIKPDAEVFIYPPALIPADPQWGNYLELFSVIPFGRAFLNSMITTISITILQLIVCSMAAYAFACMQFRGRETLFLIYLAALMVPPQVTLVPNFMLVRSLGWIDTYQGLILPFAFSSFGTFLLRQYFKTLPRELLEAARLDNCSHWRIYLYIVLPLGTTRPEMQTVQVSLATLQGQFNTDWPLLMTGSVLAVAPVLAVFILGNRSFIAGLTTSGFGGR